MFLNVFLQASQDDMSRSLAIRLAETSRALRQDAEQDHMMRRRGSTSGDMLPSASHFPRMAVKTPRSPEVRDDGAVDEITKVCCDVLEETSQLSVK